MQLSKNSINKIIEKAKLKSGKIKLIPCKTIESSIMYYGKSGYIFFYNTYDNSTHTIRIDELITEKEKELLCI